MAISEKLPRYEIDPAEKDPFFIECSQTGLDNRLMMFDVFLSISSEKRNVENR